MVSSVLGEYGLSDNSFKVEAFGSGLINNTWKIITAERQYILQRINSAVFKQPLDIGANISLIAKHLHQFHPHYKFIAPLISLKGDEMVYNEEGGYFRLFPFVTLSHSKDVVKNPEQAYEAATQFGRFTKLLRDFNVSSLKATIPSFHDLTLRYQDFLDAQKNGNKERIKESENLLKTLTRLSGIVAEFERIKSDPTFKLRVTHHDTKISNVLFNEEEKGLCVIDLDTVMPGYFISDLGDMMRTYLCPVSEEEKDYNKIEVRTDYYRSIVQGYLNEMKDELTANEKEYFFYAGKFMIYMQAIRFLTDYLNNDKYYGAAYPGHNLVRAANQAILLSRFMEKETLWSDFTA
ncbi:aminoglycoside phosphotransferase [Chitinophagaceae bacterium IBVUCB2]|nr:aminoglycoside phosphotransferase [Chitinophagaceae bacterium IBVUCB2]